MLYRLYKIRNGAMIEHKGDYSLLGNIDWNDFINDDNLYEKVADAIPFASKVDGAQLIQRELLPPIDRQEIWASGVTYYKSKLTSLTKRLNQNSASGGTYYKSKEARMEESKDTGGGTFYDKVYEANRPELFFKATAQRTAGSGENVNIRKDSEWDVPEPELTLFITSNARIVGYTAENDMSSRSIEGENPLYLPQAKVYEKCAGLGPCISIFKEPLSPNTSITMEIIRDGHTEYLDSITIDKMKRKPEELVQYLFRECAFPYGCFLMTGTGIVPPNEFTLQSGDEIRITIDNIGTLINGVN